MSLQQHTRGDDLDDDFVPDDLVAMSEEEDDNVPEGEDALFSADEGDGGEAEATKKEAAAVKKRKRREKEKERKAKKLRMQESTEVVSPASIAMQPPPALSDYLSSMQAKTFSKMSAIELADVQIPESAIADTTVWTGSRNLDQLVEFITKTLPTLRTRLAQRPKSNGAPTLLFIAGAALRVADVTRILRDKALRGEKGGDVAKLFARHFKLEDHVAYLKRTKLAAAAGTPGRLGKLLCDTDALSTAQLTHIILDISHQDSKKRNLLDIPETRDEVFKAVLGCPKVVQGMKSGKIQLVLL
ncbi:U3-containing 90S pre-ribosomal complex subunit-domain containing protein [Cristinia sonorae]|uniref:U3-containing 90S pre-ribosomal complex subunit-domain containing protein n=1 Tax=Cristinia sonorae TaxID=1940300 RepID=A0A8K0XV77_9AGAR|nr:U3-containing 90S pre-ribosomal complex subunit-domain containing protein [Cristinia sonorae]